MHNIMDVPKKGKATYNLAWGSTNKTSDVIKISRSFYHLIH